MSTTLLTSYDMDTSMFNFTKNEICMHSSLLADMLEWSDEFELLLRIQLTQFGMYIRQILL